MAIEKVFLKAADVAKRLKASPKTKKPKDTTPKEAGLVRGAGDKSDPKVGRYGAGQKQQRGGATKTAKDAMSDAEKARLAGQRSAKGSLERAKKLEPGSLTQLGDEYDKLIPSAKRAERLKGSKSKFIKVFKGRGMAAVAPKSTSKKASKALGLKMTKSDLGKVSAKKKAYLQQKKLEHDKKYGELIKARKKKRDLKRKEAKAKPKSILEGYKETKQKYSDIIDFKKGGMTGAGLYPAEMARSGTMSQAKRKKYMKKGGKITYRMTGGQVVSNGYD